MRLQWTRSATRHRITRDASGHVARTAVRVIRQSAPPGSPHDDERIVFLGPDPDGVMLELMAVETDNALVIIHAMPIRRRYRDYLTADEPKGDPDA